MYSMMRGVPRFSVPGDVGVIRFAPDNFRVARASEWQFVDRMRLTSIRIRSLVTKGELPRSSFCE
jgi:hypothetical protein